MNFLVIGFYTPDCDYQERAEHMKETVEAQGLRCEIREMSHERRRGKKTMPWVANCALCPTFIRQMMEEYPNTPILYLDADASMVKRPALFLDEPIDYDIAAPFLTNRCVRNELISNTLFFNNTEVARTIVEMWELLQKERLEKMFLGEYPRPYKEAWDQRVLQDTLKVIPEAKILKLPWEYAKIDRTSRGQELMRGVHPREVVIAQHQASRINKKKV